MRESQSHIPRRDVIPIGEHHRARARRVRAREPRRARRRRARPRHPSTRATHPRTPRAHPTRTNHHTRTHTHAHAHPRARVCRRNPAPCVKTTHKSRHHHHARRSHHASSSSFVIIITRPRSIAIDARATAPIAPSIVRRPHPSIVRLVSRDQNKNSNRHICGTCAVRNARGPRTRGTLGTIDVAKVMGTRRR